MANSRKLYYIVTFSLIIVAISLLFMNVFSIQQAVTLCKGVGGQPEVSRDIFFINWEFSCKQQNL